MRLQWQFFWDSCSVSPRNPISPLPSPLSSTPRKNGWTMWELDSPGHHHWKEQSQQLVRLFDIRATRSSGNKSGMGNGKSLVSWPSLRNRLYISSHSEGWALPMPGEGPTRCNGTPRERWNITEQPALYLLKDSFRHLIPTGCAKSEGNVRNHH